MIGNSAQDLGAMGGVAQSAGVAIGQMAEYASDAKLAGEGLGSALGSMAGVALPIAGIALATSLIGDAMTKSKKEAAALQKVMDTFTSGLQDTIGVAEELDTALDAAFDLGQADQAAIIARQFAAALDPTQLTAYQQALRELGLTAPEFIREFELAGGTMDWFVQRQIFAATGNGQLADSVGRLINQYDGYDEILASVVDGPSKDFIEQNKQMVVGLDDLGAAVGSADLEQLAKNFLDAQRALAGEAPLIDEAVDSTLTYTDALEKYLELKQQQIRVMQDAQTRAEAEAGANRALLDTLTAINDETDRTTFTAQELADAMQQAADPMETMGTSWSTLIADFADGDVDMTRAVRLINQIAEATGREPGEIFDIIQAQAEKAVTPVADLAAKIPEIEQALRDINADDIGNIAKGFEDALDATSGVIDHLKFAEDLQHEFDDALKEADKFGPDMRELLDLQAAGVTITPDITLGDLESDDAEFLAWVQSLQQMVRGGAVDAFTTGGVDAANAFVQSSAAAFLAAHPELSKADVYALFGLPPDGSLDAILKIAVDAEAKADALATLDALIGVDPNNPILAFIKLQVQTGAIDPVIAEVAALLLAKKMGVNVDPQLAEFTPEQIAQAQAQIDAGGPVTIPTATEAPDTTATDTFFSSIWTVPAVKPVEVVATSATLGPLNDFLNAVAEKRRVAEFKAESRTLGPLNTFMNAVAEQRTAHFFAQADNVTPTDTTLDHLAMPTEDGRLAHIHAHATNVGPTDTALDNLAKKRTARIELHTEPNVFDLGRALDDMARNRTTTITINTVGGATPSAAPPATGPDTLTAPGVTAFTDAEVNPLAGDTIGSSFSTPIGVPGGAATSTSTVTNNHVTIQAAVIGSRFDVQRAVTKALRQAQRLNGVRVA
jgi:hypothetical protein